MGTGNGNGKGNWNWSAVLNSTNVAGSNEHEANTPDSLRGLWRIRPVFTTTAYAFPRLRDPGHDVRCQSSQCSLYQHPIQ
jgi:hypothetical protein